MTAAWGAVVDTPGRDNEQHQRMGMSKVLYICATVHQQCLAVISPDITWLYRKHVAAGRQPRLCRPSTGTQHTVANAYYLVKLLQYSTVTLSLQYSNTTVHDSNAHSCHVTQHPPVDTPRSATQNHRKHSKSTLT